VSWREEWDRHVASLETDVVDDVFRPPLREGEEEPRVHRPYSGRSRSNQLHEERVPASLFHHDAARRTYKTTYTRLRDRGHLFCSLITVIDGEAEMPLSLSQVARRNGEWTSMRFQRRVRGQVTCELVVVNNERGALGAPEVVEQPITVVRDGDYWVAKFTWSEANKELVSRAGFHFSPLERWWSTKDRRVAMRLETLIRGEKKPAVRVAGRAVRGTRAPRHR
jgi:hypothetical protein